MKKFFSPDASVAGGYTNPIDEKSRITIIDSLRGIALLGILLMNIPYFGMPHQIGENLNIRNEYSGINYYTWWIISTGFEGTMRGLFSILFGAGTILLLSRLEQKKDTINPADIYYRRLIWLLIFGLINAFILLWPGDILYAYAICGLFLFPFRNVKPKFLFALAGFFLLAFTLKGTLQRLDDAETKQLGVFALAQEKKNIPLTEAQKKHKEEWLAMQNKLNVDNLRKEVEQEQKEMQKGYLSIMSHLKPWNIKFQGDVFYQWRFFDIMTFMFLGMALFKIGVLTGERSKRFYLMLLVVGYVLGISLAYWLNRTLVNFRFNTAEIAEYMPVDLYQFKRLFLTLGHIGLVMLLYKFHVADWLLRKLSRVGQMAFSNYLMQSIICVLIFYGFGLRWFGYMERYQLYIVVAAVWLFQILFSNAWLSYFKFGPFEWLWRSLTYWKKQPMLKQKETSNTTLEPSLA